MEKTTSSLDSTAHIKHEVQRHFGLLAGEYRRRNYEEPIERGKYPDIYMRHRHILELLDGHPPGKALEIGVGGGQMLTDLSARGDEVYGVDISHEMAKAASSFFANSARDRIVRIVTADMEHLCFPDQYFDLVVLAGVIEYVPDPEPALSEISRVLRDGGVVVVSVRNMISLGKPLTVFCRLLSGFRGIGPIVQGGMSFVKKIRGQRKAVFQRQDVPWRFRRLLRRHGLLTMKQAFYHFSVFPFALERLFPRTCIGFTVGLENLSHTPLGYLGRGCIFMARKVEA